MKMRAHFSQSFVLINLSLRGSPPGLVGDGGGVASIADAFLARHAISTPPPPNERLLKRAVNCVSKLSAIPNTGSVLRTWTVFAWLSVAFRWVCETFNIVDFYPYQEEAIVYFLDKKMDGFVIFVNLPTGFGRLLIHRSLPLVFRSFRLVYHYAIT